MTGVTNRNLGSLTSVKLALGILLTVLVTVGLVQPAEAANLPHKACKNMRSISCVYDARHQGDHHGRSFWVNKSGKRHFIAHKRAHRIVFVKHHRPAPKPKPPVVVRPPVTTPTPPTPTPVEPTPTEPTPTAYPVGYAAIGDSITYGQGSSDAATKSWPALLGIPYIGRGGASLTVGSWGNLALLDTFTADLEALGHPHTVVVEIGTNDAWSTDPASEIAGYQALLAQAEAAGVRVVLATIPPRRPAFDMWEQPIGPKVQTVNAWIRTQDHIDLDPCIGDGAEMPQMVPTYDSGDGLHPSDAGYAQISTCVFSALN